MIYLALFWGVQIVAVGLTILAVRRPGVGSRGFLLLLNGLPVALCLFWGMRFGVSPGSSGWSEESWIAQAPACFALAGLVIGIGLIVALRNARVIAALVGVLEVPTTLMLALLATMQVTGSWI